MEWSDWAPWGIAVAVAVVAIELWRINRKNRRLKALADEAERNREQAIAEQRRNQQLKQEMTSNIAHELKTPVSSIRGYLEILLGNRPLSDEKRLYYLQRCYEQTLRLSALLADVSMINKLEESATLFPVEPISLQKVANEAIAEFDDKAHDNHIAIKNLLPDTTIYGNDEVLYSIFRNLIENSVNYAGADSTVVIETYKEPTDTVFLHFYDNGVGVADEYLARLFDRFVRIDQGRSRRSGGSGLGLSIVKHAVQFHGGEYMPATVSKADWNTSFHSK